MSSIWREHAPGQWHSTPKLAHDGVGLVETPGGAILLVRDGVRVRVNGEPVYGGVRVLDHRDEILVGADRLLFSAQSAPLVTAFALAPEGRPPVCPICRGPVRDGMQAVACPGCGRWFHQLDAKPCWTYAPTCRFCQHPTPLDEAAAWRPGGDDE